jgi:hypothetical protein
MPNPVKSKGTKNSAMTSVSDKIDVTSSGATPKTYPKTREKSKNFRGEETTTVRDSAKKMLFSGKSGTRQTEDAVRSFKKDSTDYAKSADYDAKDFNNKKAYENAAAFAGKKKKI